MVQKYSIGTRDVLGERMLNEGDNLSNYTIISAITEERGRKGKIEKGREWGGGKTV